MLYNDGKSTTKGVPSEILRECRDTVANHLGHREATPLVLALHCGQHPQVRRWAIGEMHRQLEALYGPQFSGHGKSEGADESLIQLHARLQSEGFL